MSLDVVLADQIRRKLYSVIDQAKTARKKGDLDGAAEKYEHAAKLMDRYAQFAVTRAEKDRREGKVRGYLELAERLRNGDPAPARPKPKSRRDSERPQAASSSEEAPDAMRRMVRDLIYRSDVGWDDIGGLEKTKRDLQFAYALSLAKKPEGVNVGGMSNLLLYGPPGTGKTLLAAAVSNEIGATFFNVKVSNLLSKYFGESPKMVSALFDEARAHADEGFSIVFIDEFDAISRKRGGGDESGAERRLLSTLLAEMDGLAEKGGSGGVMVIAATNLPESIDPAVISRFQKKIEVPLPDADARRQIISITLKKQGLKLEGDIEKLVQATKGSSGRNINALLEQAAAQMIATENEGLLKRSAKGRKSLLDYELKVAPIRVTDVLKSL